MRELKFRAFSHGSMKYFDTPDSLQWFGSENGRNGPIKTLTECELMQYTGIKDKNDIEIYEGDIVRQYKEYSPKELDQVAVVVCGSTSTSWFWGKYGTINIALTYNPDTEVIGNIHEDPELLEECIR